MLGARPRDPWFSQLGLVSSPTTGPLILVPCTFSSRSSWTLNGTSWVANTTPMRPWTSQEHILSSRLSWTLNVATRQFIALVRFLPHTYSLQYHYQAITLIFGVPTESFAFFCGYQEHTLFSRSSWTLKKISWIANTTPVGPWTL